MAEKQEKPPAGPRYYVAANNPDGRWLPGVALRDYTAAEFKALPLWQQRDLDASGWWTTEAPAKAEAEATTLTAPNMHVAPPVTFPAPGATPTEGAPAATDGNK